MTRCGADATRRNTMPDPDPQDQPEQDDGQTVPDDDARTGEEQAAINRENDPPA